jgi:glycosyltransferase involved in cell wall biosynthesis
VPPLPLSIAIVCKNNRSSLVPVLESIRGLASEVLAVDSGSTDGTIELLEAEGARIVRTEWKGHIATKQMALELATQPWVLSIDSDEPVLGDLAASIRAALEQDDPAIAGYRLIRKVWYLGEPLHHAWQPEWRLRLVRAGKARWGGVNPHDKLDVLPGAGRVEDLPGTLRHDSFINMADYLSKQVNLSRISAESLHAEGKRGSYTRLLVSPAAAFFKQIAARSAWRDGWRGWCAAGATAVATAMKHLILIELSSKKAPASSASGQKASGN